MVEFYPWFVFAHLAGLVLFSISHGASAFMAFRLRNASDLPTARALLGMGQLSIGPMYIGLLLLIGGWVLPSLVAFAAFLPSFGLMAYAERRAVADRLRNTRGEA